MKNMKFNPGYLLIILLFTISCTTMHVLNANKETGFSLSKYKTYNFYNLSIDTTSFPEHNKRFLMLRDEMVKQLESHGLKRTSDNPELLINFGAKLEERVQTEYSDESAESFYMAQRNYENTLNDPVVGTYKQGTFSIDFVDAKTNKLQCMVVSQGVIVKNDKDAQKNISEALKKMFKRISEN